MKKRIAGMLGIMLLLALVGSVIGIGAMNSTNKKQALEADAIKSQNIKAMNASNQPSTIMINRSSEKKILNKRSTSNKKIAAMGGKSNVITAKKQASRSYNTKNPNSNKIYYSRKAIVLIYHHISNEAFSGITIKPERFEEDLKMLRDKGFEVVGLNSLIKAMQGSYRLPDNAVVITFDDGISSLYKYGFPLLKKYNMQATSFLVTSRNDSYKKFTAVDNPLSPEEIKIMSKSGLVNFQSHTHQSHEYVYVNAQLKKGAKLTSRIYNKLTGSYESEDEYKQRIIKDLTSSREWIKEVTGSESSVLCFPFGIFDKEAIELAKLSGFEYFVTTYSGANYQDSKKNKIYRIRAGDADMTTNKLFYSILSAAGASN